MRSTDDYLLPRTTGEARRLEIQSELLREATQAVLAALDVRPGSACLDVGCGTGDCMTMIGALVGAKGRVTGLDLHVRVAAERIAGLARPGSATFDVIQGDLFDPSLLAGQQYDLVFSRYLLHHMPDPVAALATMWERTKPGGVLAIVDIDQRGTTTYPVWQPYEDIERLIRELYAKTGIDNHIGHKLPHMFERAGIGAPDGTKVVGVIRPVPELAEFLPLLLDMIRGKLLENGVASASEIAALEHGLATAAAQTATYCYRPSAVGVWKRKPANA